MTLVRDVISPVLSLVQQLLNLAAILVIIRVLVSYLTVDRYHPAVRMLHQVTEPILRQARRLPHIVGELDLSPVYAVLGLGLIASVVGNINNSYFRPGL